MQGFLKDFEEYKRQMRRGAIPRAYLGLMKYFMALRTQLQKKHPQFEVSSIQYGYMDQTYFLFYPRSLKERGLKVAIVFVHDTCRFDVWLASRNGEFRKKYWQQFKASGYDQYHVVPSAKAVDPILEHTLVAEPDFGDPDALSVQIERGTLRFIRDVDRFLSKVD
jgi:hypothetical protein